MARGIIHGQVSGVGVTTTVVLGPNTAFNLSLNNANGTFIIERSFDDGATWRAVQTITSDYEGIGYEPEAKTVYRINCTAYVSGPMDYRIGTRTS